MAVEILINRRDILGESPVFDEQTGFFYWVDIGRRAWCRLDLNSGRCETISFRTALTGFAPTDGGRFIGAFEDGIAFFHEDGRREKFLHQPEKALPDNRFNDAGTDPMGRFIAGSMNIPGNEASGSLYSLDQEGDLSLLRSSITISNTVVFSPDGSVFYTADTASNEFMAFGYDASQGRIGERITSFRPDPNLPGLPDGSAVDRDGYIWNARWGGSCVVRMAPDGSTDKIIELPVRNPTSCSFVGMDLLVTSSTWEFTEEDLIHEPHAGAILRLDVGIPGVRLETYREKSL